MWARFGRRLDDLDLAEAAPLLDHCATDASSHLAAAVMGWPAPLQPLVALRTASLIAGALGADLDLAPQRPAERPSEADAAAAADLLAQHTAIRTD